MTITVHVTAEDIATGVRKSCTECPVALAIKRAYPVGEVDVLSDRIFFSANDTSAFMRSTPVQALSFIKRFDNGKPVEPFSFQLEIPEAA